MKKTNNQGKIWLKKETRPYSGRVLLLTGLSTLVTLFSLAFAYLVRYLINSASAGNVSMLWVFCAVILAVLLLKIILKTLYGYSAEKLRAKMYSTLRAMTFSKILRSDYARIQE